MNRVQVHHHPPTYQEIYAMAVSNKQLEANRRNAHRSTGPNTPEGKALSSQNAVKHGLTARRSVISAGDGQESIEEYQALLRAVQGEFIPETPYEELCVDRMAHLIWQEQRAQQATIGVLRRGRDSASFQQRASRAAAVAAAIERLEECCEPETIEAMYSKKRSLTAWDRSVLFGNSEGLAWVIGFLTDVRDSIDRGQAVSPGSLRRLELLYGSEHELSTTCANVKRRRRGGNDSSPQPVSSEITLLETEIENLEQDRSEYERSEDLELEVKIDISGYIDSPDLNDIRRYETSFRNQLRKEMKEYRQDRVDRAKTSG